MSIRTQEKVYPVFPRDPAVLNIYGIRLKWRGEGNAIHRIPLTKDRPHRLTAYLMIRKADGSESPVRIHNIQSVHFQKEFLDGSYLIFQEDKGGIKARIVKPDGAVKGIPLA